MQSSPLKGEEANKKFLLPWREKVRMRGATKTFIIHSLSQPADYI